MRRTGTQSSLELQGKGETELPTAQKELIDEIRAISSDYSLNNIYNEDESGLLYPMGPNHTYFCRGETRESVRGTSFQ